MNTMITAHSGSDGTPDNSMEYVRHALSCGADAFEIDVRANAAGEFYLSHDWSEDEGPGLHRVFALLKDSPMSLNCDLKEEGLERKLLALAEESGVLDRIILSGSVSPACVAENPQVRAHTYLNLEMVFPAALERYQRQEVPTAEEIWAAARACRKCGAEIINVYYPVCTEENLEIFRESGVGVSAWTVNEETEALRLLKRGIANITTRRPKLVQSLRSAL